MMNKRGFSLSGFAEGAVGILLVVLLLGVIIIGMNIQYSQNNDPTFGLSSNATKTSFNQYQSQLSSGLAGDASTTSATGGINLLSAWSTAKQGFNLISDFITGVWITNGAKLLQLGQAGDYLGWALRIIFVFALIFILIRLVFKVNP